MDINSTALVTISHRSDFARCQLLVESARRCVTPAVRHLVVVDRRDEALFAPLAGGKTEVVVVEEVLPGWIRRLPGARRWWLSLKTRPVRNWVLQQLVKLALPTRLDEEVLIFADSDVAFVRPFDPHAFVRDGQVRLFRVPDDANFESHRPWHRAASQLLGIAPNDYHGSGYIGNLTSWRRENVLRLHDHIESVSGRNWLETLCGQWRMSEYILYGVFCEFVLGDAARHYYDPVTPCLEHWPAQELESQQLRVFLTGLKKHHVAVMISGKANIPPSRYAKLLEEIEPAD